MAHADFEHSAVTDEARCGFGYLGWTLPGSGIPALDGMAVSAFVYCLLRRFDAANGGDRIAGTDPAGCHAVFTFKGPDP